MASQFKSIHLQLIGVSLDPRFAPIQHASDFSRLRLREQYYLFFYLSSTETTTNPLLEDIFRTMSYIVRVVYIKLVLANLLVMINQI